MHIGAGLDRHHDLFQRRVARALAEPVDGAFDLPRAARTARQAIGDGQAQIVVAMRREDGLIRVRHALAQHLDHLVELLRHGVADGVGHVDRGSAGLDRGLHAAAQEIRLGARCVHRRPFHIVGMRAGPRHRGDHDLEHLLRAHLQLILPVDRRGADEGVDAAPLGMAHRFARPVDVLRIAARQAAHDRVLHQLRNLRDGLEIAVRRGREARLDDVDAHRIQQLRDLELLVMGHGGAGRLLAVAQRGVEDQYAVFFGSRGGGVCSFGMRKFGHTLRFLAWCAEDSTNRARPLWSARALTPKRSPASRAASAQGRIRRRSRPRNAFAAACARAGIGAVMEVCAMAMGDPFASGRLQHIFAVCTRYSKCPSCHGTQGRHRAIARHGVRLTGPFAENLAFYLMLQHNI